MSLFSVFLWLETKGSTDFGSAFIQDTVRSASQASRALLKSKSLEIRDSSGACAAIFVAIAKSALPAHMRKKANIALTAIELMIAYAAIGHRISRTVRIVRIVNT